MLLPGLVMAARPRTEQRLASMHLLLVGLRQAARSPSSLLGLWVLLRMVQVSQTSTRWMAAVGYQQQTLAESKSASK